jgi:hypothetical protein
MLYFSLNPHTIERVLELRGRYLDDCNVLAIDTFLDPACSGLEALSNYLENLEDSKWWYSLHPWRDGSYVFPRETLTPDEAIAGIACARQGVFERGEFGYNFDRCEHTRVGLQCTALDVPVDNCPLCGFIKFMESFEVISLISTITGHNLSTQVSMFASRYRAESFLSIHQDTGRGKVALVFNLTHGWRPAWGGALQMMADDLQNVTRTIIPQFNSIVIFDVVGQGVPHHVTSIPREVTRSRLAVTGWLD